MRYRSVFVLLATSFLTAALSMPTSVVAQDGQWALERRKAAKPAPVVPLVPPEMVPKPDETPVIVEMWPEGKAVGRSERVLWPDLLASGNSYDDVPNGDAIVDNDYYKSWAAHPVGTQIWMAIEWVSNGTFGAPEYRRVHQLGAIDADLLWVDEWRVRGPEVQSESRSFHGNKPRAAWSRVVIPRRPHFIKYWRVYRARVSVTPSDLAEALTKFQGEEVTRAREELDRRRQAGWVLPDKLNCFVVEWFYHSQGDWQGDDGKPLPKDTIFYYRTIRHADVPGLELILESGIARDDGEGLIEFKPKMRWRVERVMHLNDTGGHPLKPEEWTAKSVSPVRPRCDLGVTGDGGQADAADDVAEE